jgi:hypothetical protein
MFVQIYRAQPKMKHKNKKGKIYIIIGAKNHFRKWRSTNYLRKNLK